MHITSIILPLTLFCTLVSAEKCYRCMQFVNPNVDTIEPGSCAGGVFDKDKITTEMMKASGFLKDRLVEIEDCGHYNCMRTVTKLENLHIYKRFCSDKAVESSYCINEGTNLDCYCTDNFCNDGAIDKDEYKDKNKVKSGAVMLNSPQVFLGFIVSVVMIFIVQS